jgi:transcriptional regulator with XRE-family HTH domain
MNTPRPGLADARRRAGFNQQTFADELGVTKHTVSQWETGATGINSRRRALIALLLEISLPELDRLIKGAALDPGDEAGGHVSQHGDPGQALIMLCVVGRPGPRLIRLTWPMRMEAGNGSTDGRSKY